MARFSDRSGTYFSDIEARPRNGLCPDTGLTIPECSCARCLQDQIDRFMPEQLRAEAEAPAGAQVKAWRTGKRREAA